MTAFGTPSNNGSGKPLIGVTMGDPCGIGAEVIVKALADPDLRALGRFIIYGFQDVLESVADDAGIRPYWHSIPYGEPRRIESGVMVVDFEQDTAGFWVNARATAEGGRASLRFFDEAIAAAKLGHIDAMVTAPINKTSWKLAGCRFAGHTDKLAEDLSARRYTMAFIVEPSTNGASTGAHRDATAAVCADEGATGASATAGPPANALRVALASAHTGLFQLRNQFSIGLVYQPIDLLNEALQNWFGIEQPRIAVVGLNPHAGEDGLLGDEEKRVIEPAMQMARNQGVTVEGPFPADSFFVPANRMRYDGVVAMYHDQGLIPVKMLAFERAVNVTLGLPVIRTSPDHGTAFDIAGTNQANPGSMKEAIRLACRIASHARMPAPVEAIAGP